MKNIITVTKENAGYPVSGTSDSGDYFVVTDENSGTEFTSEEDDLFQPPLSHSSAYIAYYGRYGYYPIICRYNGYLEDAGTTLTANYHTTEKVCDLVRLGDLRVLGKTPYSSEPIEQNAPEPHSITREEFQQMIDDSGISHVYVFGRDKKWYYTTHDLDKLGTLTLERIG